MSIDFTKPLQMRNGRKLRLLCTDAAGLYSVICQLEDTKEIRSFTLDGRLLLDLPIELMNVPDQVTIDTWVNVYDNPSPGHATKEDALQFAGPSCRATLHIKRTVPVGHVDE